MKSRLAVLVPVAAVSVSGLSSTTRTSTIPIQQRQGISLHNNTNTNNSNSNTKSISVIWFLRFIVLLILLLLSHSVWIIWKTVKFHYVIEGNDNNRTQHLQQKNNHRQQPNNNNNDTIRLQVISKQETQQQKQQQNKYLYNNHKTNMNTATHNTEPIVIAYATVLTDCTKGLKVKVPFQILESAAILQYAVHTNSIRNTNSTTTTNTTIKGKYDYKFYLLYHPNASSCVHDFQQFGFILVKRTFPVVINKMKSELLRTKLSSNGCCGERELIKLEAFTLIQHPLVVLLDLDVLLLKPLDILFDYMLYNTPIPVDHILYPTIDQNKIGTQIDLLYTVDYGMAKSYDKPIQGGFVVLRPNQTIYTDLFNIIQNGDFRDNGGWGGKSGRFWGAMTYQGIMPYYFIHLYPYRGVELNWCYYNNMKSPSTRSIYNKHTNTESTVCRIVGQTPCIDCGTIPYTDIYLFHYTVCQKPWNCIRLQSSSNNNTTTSSSLSSSSLCDIMHHLWFQTRSQMELSWGRSGYGPETNFHYNHFYGNCKKYQHTGYIPIQQPYFFP